MRVAFSSSCAWAEAHQTYATLLITYSPLHQRFVNTHPSTNNRKERKFDNCVLTLHWRSAQKLLCKVKASMLQARKKTFDDWIYDFISALSLNWRPCLFSNSGWTGGLECLIFHQRLFKAGKTSGKFLEKYFERAKSYPIWSWSICFLKNWTTLAYIKEGTLWFLGSKTRSQRRQIVHGARNVNMRF